MQQPHISTLPSTPKHACDANIRKSSTNVRKCKVYQPKLGQNALHLRALVQHLRKNDGKAQFLRNDSKASFHTVFRPPLFFVNDEIGIVWVFDLSDPSNPVFSDKLRERITYLRSCEICFLLDLYAR